METLIAALLVFTVALCYAFFCRRQPSRNLVVSSRDGDIHPERGSCHKVLSSGGATASKVFWIRHGERLDHVAANWLSPSLLAAGHAKTDPPLSSLGKLQALETALLLRSERLKQNPSGTPGRCAVIRSSPALRCVQTAVIIYAIGFDGASNASLEVDECLTDYLSSKIYKSKGPEWSGSTDRRGFYSCHSSGFGPCLREACEMLQREVRLCKKFRVKDKQLHRWLGIADCASTASLPMDTYPAASYPEGEAQLRERCSHAFERAVNRVGDFVTTSDDSSTVICVTHADVVRGVLETQFPRVQHLFLGFSVPYCSITLCERRSDTMKRGGSHTLYDLSTAGSTAHLHLSGVRFAY